MTSATCVHAWIYNSRSKAAYECEMTRMHSRHHSPPCYETLTNEMSKEETKGEKNTKGLSYKIGYYWPLCSWFEPRCRHVTTCELAPVCGRRGTSYIGG